MRKSRGLAVILFAILLQLCSSGMELLVLGIGTVGLVVTLIDDAQKVQLINVNSEIKKY